MNRENYDNESRVTDGVKGMDDMSENTKAARKETADIFTKKTSSSLSI